LPPQQASSPPASRSRRRQDKQLGPCSGRSISCAAVQATKAAALTQIRFQGPARRLTPRSSGRATAGVSGRVVRSVMLHHTAAAACRSAPLNSNVRRQKYLVRKLS
jgi:hypothetical protein